MFTFCFTTVAVAQMRRIRQIRNSTRQMTVAIRTVKLGLAALVVLAMASMAQAGTHSGHGPTKMDKSNNGSNQLSQSNQFKFNQPSNFNQPTKQFNSSKTLKIDLLKNNANKIG
jgi:hypothetical protein